MIVHVLLLWPASGWACHNRTTGCSDHGVCGAHQQCFCDPGYVTSDCHDTVLSSTVLYRVFYWTILVAAWLSAAFAVWRVMAVSLSKMQRAAAGMWCDTQFAALTTQAISVVLLSLGQLDPFAAQGLWTVLAAQFLVNVSDTLSLVGAALTVRFFMAVAARVHVPTRRYLPWLDVYIALGPTLLLAALVYTLVDPGLGGLLFSVLASVNCLLVLGGFSVYGIAVLTPAAAAQYAHSAHAEEATANLAKFARLLRGLQVVLALIVGAIVLALTYAPVSETVQGVILLSFFLRLVIVVGRTGAIWLMGLTPRVRRVTPAEYTATSPPPTAPPSSQLALVV